MMRKGSKEKNSTKKKFSWSTVLLTLIFLLGAGVVAYPSISDWWNTNIATAVIANYDTTVSQMEEDDCDTLFAEAEAYNLRLSQLMDPFADCEDIAGYEDMLRVPDSDIMGYVTIKKIDVELPLYHGTNDEVLAVGAGHLQGSSLPVGGVGTHSVISAHRGLPSARLFTSLDKLEVGDVFAIAVLNRKLLYRVDNISIISPEDTAALLPVKGEDYCTLMTCTPYGVNTHRLLVRGQRIEGDEIDSLYVVSDAFKLDPIVVAPVMAIPLLVLVSLGMIVRSRKGEEDDATL